MTTLKLLTITYKLPQVPPHSTPVASYTGPTQPEVEMTPKTPFPNDRLRWMDDLLSELQKFSERYDLPSLERDLASARATLVSEMERVNATPGHPIHKVRGPRDN